MATYRTGQGEMLDLVCLRHYGRAFFTPAGTSPGITERVLDANPGLAVLGPVLPAGTVVVLPELPPAVTPAATIKLWD